MTYSFQNLEEAAAEYARVITSPPNGWGQHIDEMGRQSHFLLMDIQDQFGEQETREAISEALRKNTR